MKVLGHLNLIKLLNQQKFLIMKQIYLLFFALTFAAAGFGQTTVIDQPFNTTTQPAGWAQTGPVTFTTGGAVFAAANGGNPNRVLTSPVFGISSFGSISFSFEINKAAGGGGGNMAVEYSINGGASYQLVANLSPIAAFSLENFIINVNPPAGTNMVIRFTKSGGNNTFNIKNVVAIGNCTPSTQASNYTTTNINSPSIGNATLNWTRGNGNNVLVVMRANGAVDADPTSGNSYAANAAFGTGAQIGTGNYVVFNGSAGTVNVTGLSVSTTYHVAIYEYNSTGNCYKTPALIGNFTVPSCEPNTQASDFSATNINTPSLGNATLSWTRGTGDNVIVVMRQGSAVGSNPVSGTSYTANAAFGTGQQIGAGNYVVYNGTAGTVNVTGLNASTTYHIAIYEYNNTGTCYKTPALTDNFAVPGSVNYQYFIDTWFPGDPNGISTAADNIDVFVGNAVISSNTLVNNVTVSSSGALTVNSGTVLQVNGILNMQSSNNSYSSLMADGTIVGAIRYDRHVNGGPGIGVGAGANDLISSPLVSSQDFGAFAASNGNIRFDTRPLPEGDPNNKVFGPFDKATGTYVTWNSVTNAANAIVSGVGYRAASTDNSGFVFRGTVNQGIVNNNIVYTTAPGVPFKQWNLVGNPYPSYINVFDFLNYVVDTNTGTKNVDLLEIFGAAVYGYDGNGSDGWTIWNLNTPEKNIAPGQGFLVQADQTQVAAFDLKFAPSMRVIGNTDDFIPNRSANTNNLHLKLRANIGTGNYHTDFYFNDNSSSGLDRGYDAVVYGSVAGAKSIYSRLVENSNGSDIAVQSLATEALGSDMVVPLGIKAAQGQQVTVSIAESDLPSNIKVYLEDNVSGTFTLLNDSDYIFTPSSTLNTPGRFFMRFSDQTLSTPDTAINGLQIYSTAAPRALFVKGQLTDTTTITMYDVQGRVVLSSQLEASSNSNQVDVSNLSSGLYVVKLNNTSQQKTQKVILK